jgi:Ca-activated chloride channel homolog
MPVHVTAHLDVDLVAIEATDTVTVMIELTAPTASDEAADRPQHTAVVVLDRSGSMSGGRLEAAKRGILELVARLDDRDSFGLVSFDREVQVVVPAGRVGDIGRAAIAQATAAITTGGTTNLSAGYLRGVQEARRAAGPAGATIVLLSDGHANVGVTDPQKLRQVAATEGAHQVTTSTIGIGEGYDENLLAAIAAGGNGNHSFAAHADAAAAALVGEVDGLLGTTVQAASLLITPTADVSTVGVLNELPSQAVAGGVMVELGDFYSGEVRRILVQLTVPAMAALGLATVADLRLTFEELPALEQHTVTMPVAVNVVPADVAAGRVPVAEVQRERLLLEAQSAKRASEEAINRGDLHVARGILNDAAEALLAQGPPPGDALFAEAAWLSETADGLHRGTAAYSNKRLMSDRMRKTRGHKNRTQGGEVPSQPADDGSGPRF